MSKESSEIKPNYAPVYCAAAYPDLCKLFQAHGYALAVHGSLARDFDLIAIPWREDCASVVEMVEAVNSNKMIFNLVGEPEVKNHGRVVYTLSIGFGECAIDLSFMPRQQSVVTFGDLVSDKSRCNESGRIHCRPAVCGLPKGHEGDCKFL